MSYFNILMAHGKKTNELELQFSVILTAVEGLFVSLAKFPDNHWIWDSIKGELETITVEEGPLEIDDLGEIAKQSGDFLKKLPKF